MAFFMRHYERFILTSAPYGSGSWPTPAWPSPSGSWRSCNASWRCAAASSGRPWKKAVRIDWLIVGRIMGLLSVSGIICAGRVDEAYSDPEAGGSIAGDKFQTSPERPGYVFIKYGATSTHPPGPEL